MSVLFVFVDGLGFGPADPVRNLLTGADPGFPFLGPIVAPAEGPPGPGEARPVRFAGHDGYVTSADACLGVPGLPQSATGQTTLLTGVNAAAFMGRHFNAYPIGRLKTLLEQRNLLARGARAGRKVTFLNMFRPEGISLVLSGQRRPSATTAAALSAGLPLRTVQDLLAGKAVYHDVTCWTIAGQHYGVPLVDPAEAARRALAVAREHDFCLYEYFLTDIAGHSQEQDLCLRVLGNLDDYLGAVVAGLEGEDTLVLASDHGNVEDLSVRTHTKNLVPVLSFGPQARSAVEGVRSIDQVAGRLAGLAGIPLVGTASAESPPEADR